MMNDTTTRRTNTLVRDRPGAVLGASSGAALARVIRALAAIASATPLDFHHLGFFLLPDVIRLRDVAVGDLLQRHFAILYVVVGGHVLLAQLAQVVVRLPARVANRY